MLFTLYSKGGGTSACLCLTVIMRSVADVTGSTRSRASAVMAGNLGQAIGNEYQCVHLFLLSDHE